MRVTALHSDLLVFVSDVWQTTSTAVRAGEEGFLIDSPVFPQELQALPGVLEQAHFPVSGLLATHADWDHLLGRLAFPEAALGAAESSVTRLSQEPGAAQRKLRNFDAEHYVNRAAPLSLGTLQSLPVPGKLELGPEHEIELHATAGHTSDGAAFWIPWLGVLVCGDYLSPVEIPMLSTGGGLASYRETLERLRPLIEQAAYVIPGHGAPLERDRALAIWEEDQTYLETMAADPDEVELPDGRRSEPQRRIHAENAARMNDGPPG
jgi:glyoxylase-like metal-dependent hydrolase (beta-lactamase superfamily II)